MTTEIVPKTREQVRDILIDWRYREWQVQGFGMLRTYLPGDTEPRLQVWDQRLACWGNNAIHDHPWAFRSTIIAGTVFNQRFDVVVVCPDCGRLPHADMQCRHGGFRHDGHVTEIIPGTRGGLLTERPVVACSIRPQPVEVYAMGDTYEQTHREMHLTRYVQGTVTLIERFDRETADRARVAWFGDPGAQPPFVNPYPATDDVVERVITDALRTWWL